ncbi:uncharacterized protein LOC111271795 [Varroa jacobsoni]|uniref:uncharacterized protein LOC111271795 n=1 Tax=Varroa jacobsoni TaxID=62625 RepID=UPI000BF43493|nr:uncharacterized protein LOC111271795 [Varroa jacobsoni]
MSLSASSEHELLSHFIGPVRRFGVRKCKRRFLQGGLDPVELEPGLDLFRRIYLKFYDHILYLLLVGKLQKNDLWQELFRLIYNRLPFPRVSERISSDGTRTWHRFQHHPLSPEDHMPSGDTLRVACNAYTRAIPRLRVCIGTIDDDGNELEPNNHCIYMQQPGEGQWIVDWNYRDIKINWESSEWWLQTRFWLYTPDDLYGGQDASQNGNENAGQNGNQDENKGRSQDDDPEEGQTGSPNVGRNADLPERPPDNSRADPSLKQLKFRKVELEPEVLCSNHHVAVLHDASEEAEEFALNEIKCVYVFYIYWWAADRPRAEGVAPEIKLIVRIHWPYLQQALPTGTEEPTVEAGSLVTPKVNVKSWLDKRLKRREISSRGLTLLSGQGSTTEDLH